jgi:pimeloyl-ACP methyl ester carboxylesterase
MPAKPALRITRPPPRLRRAYYECRFGQLHVHNAIPAGGGFDELTALLCIHAGGMTGRVFHSVLAELGIDRSVYAPDMPGSGESDPPTGFAGVDGALAALQDFLDTMRLRAIDVVSVGDGGTIARRLAATREKQVRRVALLGEPPGTLGYKPVQPTLVLGIEDSQGPRRNARLAEFLT